MIIEMNAKSFGESINAEVYDLSDGESVEITIGNSMCFTITRKQALNLLACLTRLFPRNVTASSTFDAVTYSQEGAKL